MNTAPAPDAAPHSVLDRIYSIYAPYVPAQNKHAFLAILDAAPRGTPNAQWIMDALDDLDALIDAHRPLSDEARKARGAIRLTCMEHLMKLLRERMRQEAGEFPL
jgi:hypothetical protein